MDVNLRWALRRDFSKIASIEQRVFEYPCSEDAFVAYLRQYNVIGVAAELRTPTTPLVGYVMYELLNTRLNIGRLAVHPEYQRRGIGSAIIDHLTRKLSVRRRTKISVYVRESNLDAQLFLRARGFRAVSVHRGYFSQHQAGDTPCVRGEDAYLMEYRLGSPVQAEGGILSHKS